ncbi:cation channel sperm-associated protein 3 isoform X2 [Oncorhynchus kisutch]|uniref:cation channel sperm-associated protein 3 isoform X2 n=1 Tax=Oncorhynchus kisutch TaxID=8019 RepID=UPI0012DDE49D|nr:cation channel sperm-associated protein 3 isoform X2 [Oncorhynchus kisutch]
MEQNADVKESGSGYFRFIIQKGASQIALRRFSDWDAVGRAAATAAGLNVRKDTEFYDYIANITEKTLFDGMIMVTIILNALFMALETDYDMKYKLFGFFAIADEFFMAIYTMEFLMKVYVNPGVYWKNGYNVFDAIILVISFVPMFADGGDSSAMGTMRIVRAFRSLRVLKTVSFIRGLQALVVALFKTMKSVVYVLGLMFLLMFIFAIIGYYYFGDPNTGDPENWGDLGCALFTLFSLVTVDGWTDLQQNLDDLGMNSSRIFTIVFILIGYFIFFNMFIGVVIMEIQVDPRPPSPSSRLDPPPLSSRLDPPLSSRLNPPCPHGSPKWHRTLFPYIVYAA